MALKMLKPKKPGAICKITVHKTGKLGFSKGADLLLNIE